MYLQVRLLKIFCVLSNNATRYISVTTVKSAKHLFQRITTTSFHTFCLPDRTHVRRVTYYPGLWMVVIYVMKSCLCIFFF